MPSQRGFDLVRRLPPSTDIDAPLEDSRVMELLDDIERESTPERLLTLARKLQEQLLVRKQRDRPH